MLIFDILKHGSSTMNFNSFDNIARIIKCDISKSKLALSTCNGVYFSSTALIVFTLYEIKQVKIFLGHPVYNNKASKFKFCCRYSEFDALIELPDDRLSA